MKRTGIIMAWGLALGLVTCHSAGAGQESKTGNARAADSSSRISARAAASPAEAVGGCTRGQARPIIRKDRFPNTTFVLQPDSLTAIETADLGNGDRLTIRNWGCDYYVLTFRFETTRFQHDTTDLKFWYPAAGRLMTGILADLDTPIDIKSGLVFLESYWHRDEKNNFKNLKLGEEIDGDGAAEMRQFVTLDRIEKLNGGQFGVTVSFALGPL